MDTATWLNKQARFVRDALIAGNLGEARNALRYIFEDTDWDRERLGPDKIIGLALFPMTRTQLRAARNAYRRQAEHVFTAGDDLDAEIQVNMYAYLFQDRDQ